MDPIHWLQDHARFFSREMNGYTDVPIGPYLSTLPLINQNGKVVDLGCGNGMLLKFLMAFCGHKLVPFGVDINPAAIKQAREEILPDFSDNFNECDVMEYGFNRGPFDVIISNPYYVPRHMCQFTRTCLRNLSKDGRLIYRIHPDVLERHKIKNLEDVLELQGFNMKVLEGQGVSLCVIEK